MDIEGGKLLRDDDWHELTEVKYKIADSSGKIKIMSKEEMLKEGIDSPDVADALSLTLLRRIYRRHSVTGRHLNTTAKSRSIRLNNYGQSICTQ